MPPLPFATLPPLATQPSAGGELSFYAVQVIDELETPIAGLNVMLTTPAGSQMLPTGGDGTIRVDDVPSGTATAQIASMIQLAEVMAGREQRPRRTDPLPNDPSLLVLTASRLGQTISFPDATTQRIMLVTRTDILQAAQTPGWANLELQDTGPWQMTTGDQNALNLFSNAMGASLAVVGSDPQTPPVPSPVDAPASILNSLWIPPNSYVVQPGDTLSAIAARYLGDPNRWPDIWDLNQANFPGRSPDLIFPGDVFVMTDAAVPEWVSLPDLEWPSLAPVTDDPPLWLSAGVDGLHEALFNQNSDAAVAILQSIPTEAPPQPSPDWPPPAGEAAAFVNHVVELAVEGNVDPLTFSGADDGTNPGGVAQF